MDSTSPVTAGAPAVKRVRPGAAPSSFADELAAMAGGASSASAAAPSADWLRPPLAELSPARDAIVFQWMEMDVHEGEPLAANPRAGALRAARAAQRARARVGGAAPSTAVARPLRGPPLQACPCRARARASCPCSRCTA